MKSSPDPIFHLLIVHRNDAPDRVCNHQSFHCLSEESFLHAYKNVQPSQTRFGLACLQHSSPRSYCVFPLNCAALPQAAHVVAKSLRGSVVHRSLSPTPRIRIIMCSYCQLGPYKYCIRPGTLHCRFVSPEFPSLQVHQTPSTSTGQRDKPLVGVALGSLTLLPPLFDGSPTFLTLLQSL